MRGIHVTNELDADLGSSDPLEWPGYRDTLASVVAACRVPMTSLVIGEGCSGGALALASHEQLWITPDAYFSVTSPEGATAILKRDAFDVPRVARALRVTPADLLELGVVAGIARDEPVSLGAPAPDFSQSRTDSPRLRPVSSTDADDVERIRTASASW
jgi:hypothetical protein